MMNIVLISSLNQYLYCPKLAWYQLIAGEMPDRNNADLVEGAMLHKRADSAEASTLKRGVKQQRTVVLYSRQYGLSGIADMIEESQGDIYPVEYKKGAEGDWLPHRIQLCAQAICLEEMLALTTPIRRGFLYYAATGRRKEIRLTNTLRAQTLRTLHAVQKMLRTRQCPDISYTPKCQGCSFYPVCLPRETEQIRHHLEQRSKKK